MSHELKADPTRISFPTTGIFVRAKFGDVIASADIAHLDRQSLLDWLASKPPVMATRTLLALLGHDIPECPPPPRSAEACPVHRDPCPVHNYVHGAEAEELRGGIERILAAGVEDLETIGSELQRLLDKVDARDSDGFLAAKRKVAR